MAVISQLLQGDTRIATVGIDLIDDSLSQQGVPSTPTQWRPPPPEIAASLTEIALSPAVGDANAAALSANISSSSPRGLGHRGEHA